MGFIDSTIYLFGEPILIQAYVKQIMLAVVFGLIIGAERGWHKKVASYRTFAIIATGSCLYTILSMEGMAGGSNPHDVTRVAAQIVTGIGFVGGGVIFKTGNHVEGITTAALIWLAGAIGMGCGFNHPGIAFAGFMAFLVIEFVAFVVRKLQYWSAVRLRNKKHEAHHAEVVEPSC
ncbi:MAG: MgtC/SapB family protein [Deltaproteobacteria bacterium]|nr:MgtC/SapB family protein [Deltaproteobacteria bacterium]